MCLLKRNDNFTSSVLLNPKQSASINLYKSRVWCVHYHYSSDPTFILSLNVKKATLNLHINQLSTHFSITVNPVAHYIHGNYTKHIHTNEYHP